jgi:Subtilase family/Bacterial Ig-like domain (group 3)/FG-GAP-like repeat
MPLFGHSLPLSLLSIIIAASKKLRRSSLAAGVLLFLLMGQSGRMQAQTGAAPASGQIIVKIKPSLASEAERQLSNVAAGQPMKIRAGQGGTPRIISFLGRYGARQLTPLYPQMIRAKKQHGWSDAQLAENIRQHFAARARRVTHPKALPEVSRTYLLDLGSLTPQQKTRTLERLKADPDVEFAEPTHTFSTNQLPNDPFLATSGSWGQPYQDLWGLFAINAPAAWDTVQGDGIVVAVVDTGVDYNHPDLANNIWTNPNDVDGNFIDDDGNGFVDDVRGWNFMFNNNDPRDQNGHGTHVAGTIAALGNNGIGVIGVAWHSKIMPVTGLDDNGFGFDFSLAPAIIYAASNGADVINASWGGQSSSQSIEEAIQFATGLGTVFVAAAGNLSLDATNFFPASSPEAIAVASSDPFGNFSFFSDFGPKIDATAPGEDILSLQAANTFQGQPVIDGYTRMTGTSMAAPNVSGVAALVLSGNPAYSTEQVRQVIHVSNTTVPFDSRFGSGKLNAAAAVTIVNLLDAKITGLQFGDSPIDPITILGSAQGTGFASYLLEYGAGTQPFFFTPFFSSTTPTSGVLGQLDPSNLSDGTYTIRLTVFNTNGIAFVDSTQFTLTFVQITSPPVVASTYKPGFVLPIIGTAVMPGFRNFTVQWAGQDGVWQTSGITLSGDGFSPLANTQLATWDTSGITQAGNYLILLTVNGNQSEQVSTQVYLEPDLLSFAWPIFLDTTPCLECPVVPALNPDGSYRLVTESPDQGAVPGASWVIHPDGSMQKTVLNQFGADHQPSAGNLDGLPGDEAVMADFSVIDVFHPDNTFDVFNPGINVFLSNFPIVLEDLNNDFQLESITVGGDFSPSNRFAYVFAWKPDGQQASGFPIQIQDNNSMSGTFNLTRVIAGDFDGDGLKDILVLEGPTFTTYDLRLFNHDGTPKPFNAPILTGVPAGMAAADLDHNGKLETILVNHSDSLGTQAAIHVFQPDGSERPGWPVDISASHSSFFSYSGIAVGDLRRDGHEEIVVSNGSGLYIFNSDGTLFSSAWPLPIANSVTYLRPLIADIDGDGLPEIVIPFNDFNSGGLQLRAFHSDGSVLKTWALTGVNNFEPNFDAAATIGDFNQDGSTDIAVAYGLSGSTVSPGTVTMLDTHSPFAATNNDWPMVLQNPRNNPVLLRTSASSLAVTLSTGSNPSTLGDNLVFTATLTPATGNGSIQFLDGGATISGSIPLSNGSASFSTADLGLGPHSITARYTGDNKLSSSVSPALIQNVNKPNTSVSVTLTTGANPSLVGNALTFTANVAPNSATGTVVFFDGSNAISGDVTLVGGTASFTTSQLSFGIHSITAQYSGDAAFNGSTSAAFAQTVNNPKANSATSVSLTAGTNPSVYGDSLTFTANVTPASATGTVVFFDGTTPISSTLTLSSGTATLTIPALGPGTHSITAQYSGDANVNPSTSAAWLQTVNKANTAITLVQAEDIDGLKAGAPGTFMATVTPANATGSVVFFDGTTPISAGIPLNNGTVVFTTSTLAIGTHMISAQFGGDANFNGSLSNSIKVKVK